MHLDHWGFKLKQKIRAEGTLSLLESLDTVPQYFVQCHGQMLCTDVEFCILQSYHPEQNHQFFLLLNEQIL